MRTDRQGNRLHRARRLRQRPGDSGAAVHGEIKQAYEAACRKAGGQPEPLAHDAAIETSGDVNEMIRQGEQVTIHKRIAALGDDVAGLQELITYGLKNTLLEDLS